MILPEHWGKRYGSAIMNISKQADVSILKAIMDPDNIPSRKILLNVGFTSEIVSEIDGLLGEILSTYL